MSMNQETLTSLSGGGHGPICTVVMSSTHDQPPKISPSVMLSDRIEPPQHIQPPTFYVSHLLLNVLSIPDQADFFLASAIHRWWVNVPCGGWWR